MARVAALLVSATFEPIAEFAAEQLGVDAFLATKMQVGADGHYGLSKVDGPEGAQSWSRQLVQQRFGEGNWEMRTRMATTGRKQLKHRAPFALSNAY